MRKLSPHETVEGEAEALVTWLEAKGWVDASRVAESVVHQRASRYGDRRIRADLQAKGLDADAIETALAQAPADERSRAQAVWAKKFDALPSTPAERAKQMRFLIARGFGMAAVNAVLKGQDD